MVHSVDAFWHTKYAEGPDGRLAPVEAQQLAIFGQTFAALDADGDGYLSWGEFASPGRLAALAETCRSRISTWPPSRRSWSG